MWEHPPKYDRTYHWITSPEVHSDDKVHTNPEVFLNVELIITEKLDGGNTALWDGNPYARSTGQIADDAWFQMVKEHHAWKTTGIKNKAIYGEDLYAIHSIVYAAMRAEETYRVFGIREGDEWYSWDELVNFCQSFTNENLGMDFSFLTVPLVYRGKFKSIDEISKFLASELQKPSALGKNREGFVIRYADRFAADEFTTKVAKYVRKGHVQTDKHWRKNWQPCELIR